MRARERPERRDVLHGFADYGIESEVFPEYWDVVRFGLDPEDVTGIGDVVAADAMRPPFDMDTSFDLVVLHPECARYSNVTSISGDPEDHENQIPPARVLAEHYGEHWIIENVPTAPLNDPVVLNGYMFGLPVKYERAFETSFPIHDDVPPGDRERQEVSPYFHSDRSSEWWMATKGYTGRYRKGPIAKNCVPSPYLRFLLRQYLKTVNERDVSDARGSQ